MKKDDKNLSESLKELDGIVDWFEERDEVDVEGGLEKVKVGVKLVSEIKKQLKDVENEFEEVKNELKN